MDEIIELVKLIGRYPSTRVSVDNLFDKINSSINDNITIDFANVFGITHSFAAQYIFNKKKCKKIIKEENKNTNVNEMFNLIGKTRKIDRKENLKIETFVL